MKGDENEYWTVVDNFVTWSEQIYLQLNVTKTKELIVDLRRAKTPVTPVSIQGEYKYKYLGVYFINKLVWGRGNSPL